MKTKRGQGSPQSYISLLIFVTTIAIIIYILMLPPADRAELLEQNRSAADDGKKDDITVLMTREPGTISNIADDEIITDLPAFNLFTRTDATVLAEFDSIYVQKSLFEEEKRNITFGIDNFENTGNVILSFTAPRREGRLTITLNGHTILSREVDTASPKPLKLPVDLLEQNNNIVFEVSGPGIRFWDTNEFSIENLKITADVTDVSSRENIQTVLVTKEQMDNLESFELSFAVECKAPDVAPLQVYLNKRQVYYSVPDCGSKVEVPPLDAERLRQGENELLFRTEKGSYELYRIETRLKLKEPIYPTYYFTLNRETFKKIEENTADINVTMVFTNDVDRKKGIVLVNGYFFEINTYDQDFNRRVDDFVREGNNAVEIKPETDTIDVLELKVILSE